MKKTLLVMVFLSGVAQAEGTLYGALAMGTALPNGGDTSDANTSSGQDSWFARSDAAKESQPHWMTPIVTVTPRLEQEFRYDQLSQAKSGGVNVSNYGLNKGLELIPTMNSEIIVGIPGYQVTNQPKGVSTQGWADETLLFKYRMLSANEENGNYIVTGFMGVSLPTGDSPLSTGHYAYTPTLAVGKGWGTRESGFDIQSTLAITVPDRDMSRLGEPIVWNTAFQGHFSEYWWPELETQYTHFSGGPNNGKNQTVITPGMILGRYELIDRLKFVIGLGYQKAVGGFQTFNNAWQLTARTPF
ncbi:MAG: hypothetical protein KGK17_07065 [Betaproteobacteria bacterium]|nr:hypothetical protein [Betaproteobacteria bacterium]